MNRKRLLQFCALGAALSVVFAAGSAVADPGGSPGLGAGRTSAAEREDASVAISTPGGESVFHPLPPTRILDTRSGNGAPAGKLGAGATLLLQVTGRGGVPADATSLVYNLAVTAPTASSHLTVYPSGTSRPLASSINFSAGQTIANGGTTKLGADGKLAIFNNAGATHVILDVAGYYGPSKMLGQQSYVGWATVLASGSKWFSHASNGLAVTSTRLGVGLYDIRFFGAPIIVFDPNQHLADGFVSVMGIDNSSFGMVNCRASDAVQETNALRIRVACTSEGNVAQDSRFYVLVTG
jgi:hypothetical protein